MKLSSPLTLPIRETKISNRLSLFLFLWLTVSCGSDVREIRALLDNQEYLEAKKFIENLDGDEFSKLKIKNLYVEANIGYLNQLIFEREYNKVIAEIDRLDYNTRNNPDIENFKIDASIKIVEDYINEDKLHDALQFIKEADSRIKSNERIKGLDSKLNDNLRILFHGWWYGYNTKLTHIKIKVKVITLTRNTFYGTVYFYCYYEGKKSLSWSSLTLSDGYFDGEEFSSEAVITFTRRQFQYITGQIRNTSMHLNMNLNFCLTPDGSLEWILEKDPEGSKNL